MRSLDTIYAVEKIVKTAGNLTLADIFVVIHSSSIITPQRTRQFTP